MSRTLVCRTEVELYGASEQLTLYRTTYADGNTAILIEAYDVQMDYPAPFGVLSVNIPSEADHLQEGEFFAKNYSEGKDLFDHLVNEGLIEHAGWRAQTGYVSIPAVRFTEKAKETINGKTCS